MTGPPARLLGIGRQDPIGGAKKRRQPEIDQIDAGDAEREVARCHHALVEQPIDEVEQARLRRVEELVGNRRRLSGMWHERVSVLNE